MKNIFMEWFLDYIDNELPVQSESPAFTKTYLGKEALQSSGDSLKMEVLRFLENQKKGRFYLWVFLLFYLALTFGSFRDYGATIDENDWYVFGVDLLKHYRHTISPAEDAGKIFSQEQASHNYIYPALLKIFNRELVPEKMHLLNMLFGSIGFAAAFEVLFFAYKDSLLAALAPLFLLLTLRFSGDIPANPKDAPFAALFLLSLSVIYLSRAWWKDRWLEALLLGSLVGITSCVRAIGLTLLPIWVLFRFYEFWETKNFKKLGKTSLQWVSSEWLNGTLLFVVSQFWMMALWPYLGSNYFGNYLNIFQSSQKYTWPGPIIFMGKMINTYDLPWYYLPLWLLITLPVFSLVFFAYSFLRGKSREPNRLHFLLSLTLGLHLFLYFALKPVIYGGLRHYLFVVPIVCLMGTIGILEFFKNRPKSLLRTGGIVFIGLNALLILVQWTRLYPLQYAYFNELAGGLRGAAGNFETDYWGGSLKEASQWLSRNLPEEKGKIYKVKTCGTREQQTHYFRSDMAGDNDMKDPDLEIYLNDEQLLEVTPEIKAKTIYTVQREGVPLAYVFKLK